MAFIPYNANPLYKDTDDCTVRAISLFTGKTYDETFVGIAVTGFELKQVMVTNSTWARYLLRLGYVRTAIPNYCSVCSVVPEPHSTGKSESARSAEWLLHEHG